MTTWNPDTYDRHTRFVSELGSAVVELLRPQPGERLLDLGCGDGVLTQRLVELGCDVVGVDASPEMVDAARRRRVDARVIDAQQISFVDDFDAVFSNAALHWMKRPDSVISGVWRALKRPGRFVGEFGGAGNVRCLHRAIHGLLVERGMDFPSLDPWYFPDAEEYRSRLEAAGFTVAYTELIERPTPLPTGIAGWMESVAHTFLNVLPAHERDQFVSDLEDRVRSQLLGNDGVWYADYVRLRFQAFAG